MSLATLRRTGLVLFALLTMAACGGGGSGQVPPPTGLSYPSPQTYTVGMAVAPLMPTVAGAVTSYAVSPALPAGLVLNSATGSIAGTPGVPASTASYTISAQNDGGATTFALTITVIAAGRFWLEPATSTTIAIGQSVNLHAAFQATSTDAYPRYIDAGEVTWGSSQPGFAAVSSQGIVTGLSDGTTVITAQYETHSSQLTVQVSGTMQRRTLSTPGQGMREYSIYTPRFETEAGPHPALLAIHGGGGSGMIQAATTRLHELASREGAYVVYLEGSGLVQTFNAGNCCGFARDQGIDDVAYVNAVLDDVQADFDIDPARVIATGFSNGGMMSHRLACSLADRIGGIAAVGGGSGELDADGNSYYSCMPSRPIPVLQIHAANDRNYPYDGGFGDGLSATNFRSIEATIADWIARNNVTSTPTIESVTKTTTCYRYSMTADVARPSAPVILCKLTPPDVYDAVNEIVFGGGHSWPGGARSPAPNSDVPVADFDANAYLWAFFNP